MGIERLDDERSRALSAAPLSYPDVGGTTEPEPPSGYHYVLRQKQIGRGHGDFERACDDLFAWRMHVRSGLSVAASGPADRLGSVVVLRLGVGPLGVDIPCRVVHVVDEPGRRGFSYGTLPGHPEAGEESFVVRLEDDDVVTLTIRAFSRPATPLTRAAGPAGRLVQAWQTTRYLNALRPRRSAARSPRRPGF